MKKILIIGQVVIVLLIGAKLFTVGQMQQKIDASSNELSFVGQAMAQFPVLGSSLVASKDLSEQGLQKEKDLYRALEKRKVDLDARETAIKQEEQKLLALKKEISDKVDVLRGIEKQLETNLEAQKTAESKRFKDLAKMYEAAAPAKAASMLEKLDTRTAAGIAMSMKRDKAGAVLSSMNVQKAVEITKEISFLSKNMSEP